VCGDQLILGSEECDDGNTTPTDGCSASCQIEPYHACDGEPSVCTCAVFVRVMSVSTPDGESWATAYGDVQSAVDTAATLGGGCEVWVAQGTYHIYQSGAGDTLALASDVGVYGGFDGTETRRDQRDPQNNHTMLDGADPNNSTNRVHHVITADGITGAWLDGFTVRNGLAGGSDPHDRGGGLYVNASNLMVAECLFTDNRAARGGAIYTNSSGLTLVWSTVQQSRANDGGGLYIDGADPALTYVTFYQCTATNEGGGMFVNSGTPSVRNCVFVDNSADDYGGGVNFNGSSPEVINSLFVINEARRGGAVEAMYNANPVITNCTFYGNTSSDNLGAAVRAYDHSDPVIRNSIIWNHSNPLDPNYNSSVTVTYSDVQGGYSGTGNIDQDPEFVSPATGNFHLQASSPCIDAANEAVAPATDFEGQGRVDGPAPNTGVGPPWVDMGVHEYQ
jgi:cysteine-rich repeat protein/predicted outer membrane repeat protein